MTGTQQGRPWGYRIRHGSVVGGEKGRGEIGGVGDEETARFGSFWLARRGDRRFPKVTIDPWHFSDELRLDVAHIKQATDAQQTPQVGQRYSPRIAVQVNEYVTAEDHIEIFAAFDRQFLRHEVGFAEFDAAA